MISIPARIYSRAIWETIRYRTKEYKPTPFVDVGAQTIGISIYTADMLARISRLFSPRQVVEIGTGTGRSSKAIADGMRLGHIDTCDTETLVLHHEGARGELDEDGVLILKHPGISTEMFKQLTKPVDLFFLDGRVQPDDIPHIQRLAKPDCVIALDDFEGIEKGVANALMIQHLGGLLVYPEEGQTLGMMIRKVGFTRQ